MHGTAGIGALLTLTLGGAVVTLTSRSLDAAELWRAVEEARCTTVSIVGDVFCGPMVDELDATAAAGHPYDISSLHTVRSSGVMWSQETKQRLLAHHSGLVLADAFGSAEAIGLGMSFTSHINCSR